MESLPRVLFTISENFRKFGANIMRLGLFMYINIKITVYKIMLVYKITMCENTF